MTRGRRAVAVPEDEYWRWMLRRWQEEERADRVRQRNRRAAKAARDGGGTK